MIHYYYIIGLVGLLVICLLCYFFGKKKKHHDDNDIDNNIDNEKIALPIYNKNYLKYNQIGETYLVYNIEGEDHYITWRYAGQNIRDKMTYKLVLLSYKNKQNEFKVHLQDYHYLKKFHEQYGLYDESMKDELNEQVFATSDYNENKEQYLELDKVDEEYRIKASVWSEKGPFSYLHIDHKNKLYFDAGIHDNTIKVRIG
jgi:hypothetical protein